MCRGNAVNGGIISAWKEGTILSGFKEQELIGKEDQALASRQENKVNWG